MEENCCKSCKHPINDSKYCSNCGHPAKLKKIDRNFIIHEFKETLFADKGFLYHKKNVFNTRRQCQRLHQSNSFLYRGNDCNDYCNIFHSICYRNNCGFDKTLKSHRKLLIYNGLLNFISARSSCSFCF